MTSKRASDGLLDGQNGTGMLKTLGNFSISFVAKMTLRRPPECLWRAAIGQHSFKRERKRLGGDRKQLGGSISPNTIRKGTASGSKRASRVAPSRLQRGTPNKLGSGAPAGSPLTLPGPSNLLPPALLCWRCGGFAAGTSIFVVSKERAVLQTCWTGEPKKEIRPAKGTKPTRTIVNSKLPCSAFRALCSAL